MKKLVRLYLLLISQTIFATFRYVQKRCSPSIACDLQNIYLALRKSDLRFKFSNNKELYVVKEGDLVKYFGDMRRGFDFYSRGIKKRGYSLAEAYCLENIKFNPDDIVIDCGANYGDLYLFLGDKIKESNYIAIEPGPVEYKCLRNNLPNSQILNLGLSNEDGELDFYLCSKSGDSSLVEPKSYTEVVKVKVSTIDNLCRDLKISKCRLFKLEAEGWEPEILEGAYEFIKSCDYIAVDGGRERGVNEEVTLHSANNFLMKNGFEMIDINGPGYRALYKKVF